MERIRRILRFILNIFKCVVSDDLFGMASEMAFNFVLALFPFLIFLVSLFGLLGTEEFVNKLLGFMAGIIPSSVLDVIGKTLHGIINSSSESLLTFGFVMTIVVSSNAMAIIMKGLNKVYNVSETRPFWYTRTISIGMLFLNAMVIFIGVNSIVFGKVIINLIITFSKLPINYFDTALFLRWPVVFLALFTVAYINYYFLPNIGNNKEAKFYSTIPGSIFFCVFWLVASWCFSLYVNNFGVYNKVYGTLGAFAVMLVWLYYTSLVILIGGEINSQFFRRLKDKKDFLFDII